jgi:LmbE family N-acetylglucosaminyl deacetylase
MADLGRLVVVSPHLDDGVFGCGELLAAHPGAVVVTVFAGLPELGFELPEWDATCGFSNARAAVSARRREDRAALERLDAQPCWLGCYDSQYRRPVEAATIALRLARALRRHPADTIAIPLGLFHSDHHLAHQAAMQVFSTHEKIRWLLYADAVYRRIPGLADERLAVLARKGVAAMPLPGVHRDYSYEKRRAVECYASQLRGLSSSGRPGPSDVLAPERYWRLST